MAQLMSLQRRLTSTVVLGTEVKEREMREAMMRLEEEKVKLEAKRSSFIKSWWRRMVCRQTLFIEEAFPVVEGSSQGQAASTCEACA